MFGALIFLAFGPGRQVSAGASADVGRVRGLRIEQVGMPNDGTFWHPDGSQLSSVRFENNRSAYHIGDSSIVVTYQRSPTRHDYAYVAFMFLPNKAVIPAATDTMVMSDTARNNDDWYAEYVGQWPKRRPMGDVAVGIADGPWEVSSLYRFRNGKTISHRGVNCLGAFKEWLASVDNSYCQFAVRLPSGFDGKAMCVYAFNNKGSEMVGAGSMVREGVRLHCFKGKMSDVARLEVRTCPYKWTTFKGVKLSPPAPLASLPETTNKETRSLSLGTGRCYGGFAIQRPDR